MKNKFKIAVSFICIAICLLSFTACAMDNPDKTETNVTALGSPKAATRVDYSALRTDGYLAFKRGVEAFAADFAAFAYADCDKPNNFAVSPISVYMALALASECSDGNTRQEILSALNVTYGQLQTHFATLYNSLEAEYKTMEGDVTSVLDLSNSIWVNKGTAVKDDCLRALSDNFYAYSYSADFKNGNKQANEAVQAFVKEQTRGLIDKSFKLPEATLFALINTLYLKTVWNGSGRDLPFADGTYAFTSSDGSSKDVRLLQGGYVEGRKVQFDNFSAFYTSTLDGYKIKFILPNAGSSINQVFTSQNIAAVNSVKDYGAVDTETNTQYFTRVIFPEYKCNYDKDVKEILENDFGIKSLFGYACNFSSLTDNACSCDSVCHVTDLTVDKTGVEGAAVTVMIMAGSSAPVIMNIVREDFVVDRAFGFIITDKNDVTLFSGVVENV